MPSGCAMSCTDDYAGVARLSPSPFRITTAPLRKSLLGLRTVSPIRSVSVIPLRELRTQESPSAFHPPKRYLLACTFRL